MINRWRLGVYSKLGMVKVMVEVGIAFSIGYCFKHKLRIVCERNIAFAFSVI